jgi:hypothetical protein
MLQSSKASRWRELVLRVILGYSVLIFNTAVMKAFPKQDGTTGVTVVIEPGATMLVRPFNVSNSDSSKAAIRWFRVDLSVRVNTGATASLVLEHTSVSADAKPRPACLVHLRGSTPRSWNAPVSPTLFKTQANGRFSVLVGIDELDRACLDQVQFVLRSSDGAFHLYEKLRANDD